MLHLYGIKIILPFSCTWIYIPFRQSVPIEDSYRYPYRTEKFLRKPSKEHLSNHRIRVPKRKDIISAKRITQETAAHTTTITMASLFRTCLDGHKCENGSSCAEHPAEEGKYYCDCDTSNGDFAGLFCEYEAETYCSMESQTSETSFCTNMGTCVLNTNAEPAWSCDCPPEFDGPVRQCLDLQESIFARTKDGMDFLLFLDTHEFICCIFLIV